MDGGSLVGALEMPLALGVVGGALRAHRGARLALDLVGTRSAGELAMVAAAAGLATNLAALRALATEGIQRGHMALHHRATGGGRAGGERGGPRDTAAERGSAREPLPAGDRG